MDRNVETVALLPTAGTTEKPTGRDRREIGDVAAVDGKPGQRRERRWRSELEARMAAEQFEESEVELDHDREICWLWFKFAERPCFTPGLLRDVGRLQNALVSSANAYNTVNLPLKYVVLASRMPGVWNLGGDLGLFVDVIRRQDREMLTEYAYRATHEVFVNWTCLNLPVITVSLVQGDALGGGFEAALSASIIVAERSARFGLPEILFSLFPGMGSFSFLARRTTPAMAMRMITGGKIYSGEELYEMGIVDVLAEDGKGKEAFYQYVDRNASRHTALRSVIRARQRFNPVTFEELRDVGEIWIETLLSLSDADLRKMERLATAQDRRRARALKKADDPPSRR